MVQRARVVLMAAQGETNRTISTTTGLSEQAVSRWRARYRERRLEGLRDLPRSGRPPVHGAEARLRIAATVTQAPPEPDSQWTHQSIADRLTEYAMSAPYIGCTLRALDLKPHKVRGRLNRRDTVDFWERAADVCGLYLSPPANALVLSVNEKTAISARPPTHPTQPPASGRPARRGFEYVRHGVVNLMAALDVTTGEVLARDVERNDAAHFIGFLAEIDGVVAPELDIHLVMDNGSSHVAEGHQGVAR